MEEAASFDVEESRRQARALAAADPPFAPVAWAQRGHPVKSR